MICDKCNERTASIVITQTIGDKTIKHYFCDVCAAEKEGILFENNNSFQHFLTGLINAKTTPFKNEKLKCENCGMTIDAFKKDSKVGCAKCYQTFNSYFAQLIKRIHANVEHTGKRPRKLVGEMKTVQKIDFLQEKLNKAVQEEEYELAARLRDEIKLLKQGGTLS